MRRHAEQDCLLVLLPWIENVEHRVNRLSAIGSIAILLLALAVSSVVVLNDAVENAGLAEDARANLAGMSRANLAEWDRLLAKQSSLYAREARLEREQSRLILREADLLPRYPDYRGKRLLLDQRLRSVKAEQMRSIVPSDYSRTSSSGSTRKASAQEKESKRLFKDD